MRILIIGPNLGMGGVEKASSQLANALCQAGQEVAYLSLIPKEDFFTLDPRIHRYQAADENVGGIRILPTIRCIRSVYTAYSPDVVLSYTKYLGALTALAAVGRDITLVVSERSSPSYRWPWKIEYFCRMAFGLRPPEGILAQTSAAAEAFASRYPKSKITVIPNLLEFGEWTPDTPRSESILWVGRPHDACKGFDLALEALAKVDAPSWPVYFAGIPEQYGQAELQRLGIDMRGRAFHFLGKVKDLQAWYQRAGIFLMSSRSEGFPNALGEALAVGVPSISFDFEAGARDMIIPHENGLLIPPEDTDALARGLEKLIQDPALRKKFSNYAPEFRQAFSHQKIIDQCLHFFSSLR